MRTAGLCALLCAELLACSVTLSCGGSRPYNICACTPTSPASKDYRHDAKHVPLPAGTPQEISINTILAWPQGPTLPASAPRSGRELQLFHVSRAYLQSAHIVTSDCDLHFEVSETADKTAPRVILETPRDPEYCSSRQDMQQRLAKLGIKLPGGSELNQPAPVSVLGLAFQDFEHDRGSHSVATVWELHPAIVIMVP